MKAFFKDESGASLVEYGLLVGLIAVAAITAVTSVGNEVGRVFNAVADRLETILP